MVDNIRQAQKRQIAYKSRIKDLINGKYVKNEGEWAPNFIEVGNKQISRVNLIGTVVLKPMEENLNYQSVVLDDGSGKISVRSFDENSALKNVDVGDVVLLIGRPREFGTEKYIVPEIMKKIENTNWIKLRKLELDLLDKKRVIKESKEEAPQIEEEVIVGGDNDSVSNKIFSVIKEIDSGDGADTEEVIVRSNIKEAEGIINNLLEKGEIFEITPGKLKVLE